MRTVHEPEQIKGVVDPPITNGKKPGRAKATNGTGPGIKLPHDELPPTHDEDGKPVAPSYRNDNIEYLPAHHPVTKQPGFMITYPPDVNFTTWESSITADQLMWTLWNKVRLAEEEQAALKAEEVERERIRNEEWGLKDLLLEGVLEAELANAEKDGLLRDVDEKVRAEMEKDVRPEGKQMEWTGGTPPWRKRPRLAQQEDPDAMDVATPGGSPEDNSPSPPPTGKSGGFDG